MRTKRCSALTNILLALLAVGAAHAAESARERADVIGRYGLEQGRTPVSEQAGWRKPRRILVAGFLAKVVPELQAAAPDVEFVVATPTSFARQAADVDAVIGTCAEGILEAGKSIRWIQLLSAGVERCVSLPAVRERDILVTNMQRIGGPVIAEHTMAMMLALTRGLAFYIPAQTKGEWRRVTPPGRMTVVAGKTMLVVGLGGIGSEVAQRAHALGMRVIATRASSRKGPDFVSYVGLPDELPELAGEADVIVNTAPLTAQTRGMFDATFFASARTGAYFINVARGASVDTSALVDALRQGKIAGAGLDVTDPEPLPPDHPLWKMTNVIITPHVANDSDLGPEAELAVVKENLRRYSAGERMLSVVDVRRGY